LKPIHLGALITAASVRVPYCRLGRETDVESTYEIFKEKTDATVWVGSVKGLELTKKTLISLNSASRSTYFAYDPAEKKMIEIRGYA
jgi:hypothetical protein